MGVAFLDAAARRLGACEFADDEHFCSLEAVLLQLGVKEVVLPKARSPPCPLFRGRLRGLAPQSTSYRLWSKLHSKIMLQRCEHAHAAVQDAEGAAQSADFSRGACGSCTQKIHPVRCGTSCTAESCARDASMRIRGYSYP